MSGISTSRKVLIAQGLFVLTLIALGTGLIVWSQNRSVRAAVQDGPAASETLDLLSWSDRKGRTLAEVNKGHSLALLVLLDPSCANCAASKETLKALRSRSEKTGMAYYVVMIPSSTDTEKYFAYADSLNLEAESFVWSNAMAKPPLSLSTMPALSHLLVNSEGIVENKWAGVPSNESAP
jgi:hypothetical protein